VLGVSDASFSITSIIHPYAPRTLADRLHKERLEWTIKLVNCQSWEHYKEQVGFLRGLERAIQMAEEIEKELSN
jgi:hypothetical protein